jgi:hypothetical protein
MRRVVHQKSDKSDLLIRWRGNSPSSAAIRTPGQRLYTLTHCAGSVSSAVEGGVRALPPAGRGLRGEDAERRREEEEESTGDGGHCYSQAGGRVSKAS